MIWPRRLVGFEVLVMLVWLGMVGCADPRATDEELGIVELTIVDAASGEMTPARVEILDGLGRAVISEDALRVFSDCGHLPLHNWLPGVASIQASMGAERAIQNPYTGTTQFYSAGSLRVRVPAGRVSYRVSKGMEYRVAVGTLDVTAGEAARREVHLERWVDLAREGWYGADDHLHIQRPSPRFDRTLALWMQAEGLNVGNFLQMGLARDVHITPQYDFGPSSSHLSGDTLLLSGQENPRTHVLGHSIVLGARGFIDRPSEYLLYDRVWREARRQGAISGYAHWAAAGAEEGLAVWGHEGLLDFVEVLNLGFPFYDRWYEALNLGLRLGPTAGTDFPCLPSLPGRERFYARLDGPLEQASWLEAVRRGRTFVTNGPVIELMVNGSSPGEEVQLSARGEVQVQGRVRFDPGQDEVLVLELVRGGEVVERVEEMVADGELVLDTQLLVDESTWLALRTAGTKRDETEIDVRALFSTMLMLERSSNRRLLDALPSGAVPRPSAAHTGVIWVNVEGTSPVAQQPKGREVARLWLGRLEELERRLADDRIEAWADFPGRGDGIDLAAAKTNRKALLEAIEAARKETVALSGVPD